MLFKKLFSKKQREVIVAPTPEPTIETATEATTEATPETKYCKNCGNEIHEDYIICRFCGIPVKDGIEFSDLIPPYVCNNRNYLNSD